jgi:alpha-L-fucosidase 2
MTEEPIARRGRLLSNRLNVNLNKTMKMDLRKISMILLIGIATGLLSSCQDKKTAGTDIQRGFWSEKPAINWEHSLVTGNGTMGVLVMGQPLSDTLILSHAKLYMPLHEPLPPVNSGAKLDTIRQLMFAGKYAEASQYVVDLSHSEGWVGKRWTDPFVPAFNVLIQMVGDTLVEGYKRSVDFASGVASVTWNGAAGTYSRRVFASRADTLVVISVRGPAKGSLNCNISLADRPKDNSWWQSLYNKTNRATEFNSEEGWLAYQATFDQEWDGSLKGLAGAVRVIHSGGTAEPSGSGMNIRNADEVLLMVRVEPEYNSNKLTGGSRLAGLKNQLMDCKPDYGQLLKRHVRIHGELFERVSLDLNGGSDRNLSSETLLGRSARTPLPALLEKEFDAARYNILSATGIMQPNLQGIWAGTTAPPWSGDFTQNGNLQVAIAGLLSGNMPELMEAFFSYQESMLPDYRENARRLYNARGIHVASRTSSHGLNNHFDRTWPMTFWTAGAAWMSQFFYDYYLYTGNLDFLKRRAMPFMQEAALFYQDFLISGPDGKWIFIPSYSPENNPGNSPDQACINATMDVMAARQLFRNLIEAGQRLSLNRDTIAAWQVMLSKMPDYQVNSDGALREYMWDSLTDNYAHRHASHLYGLWDVTDPAITADPRLMEACRRAVDERMKVRRQEDGGVMAFGMVQLALAAAAVGDAVAVQDMINWLGSVYWFPNLVTTHNPHELFNLDLSGGFPAVIIKSLVYSEPGAISLLPACPPNWKTGAIRGILLRGQVTLESMNWNEKEVEVRLLSQIDQTVKVACRGRDKAQEVQLRKGRAVVVRM